MIYIPLVFIFVAARSILPGLATSDDVMPSLVIKLANPYLAGLILAAPYGAVLSTVSGWLLIVSSGLVRDLYQRFLRPSASEREIARASYSATVAVGLVAAIRRAAAPGIPATDHRLLRAPAWPRPSWCRRSSAASGGGRPPRVRSPRWPPGPRRSLGPLPARHARPRPPRPGLALRPEPRDRRLGLAPAVLPARVRPLRLGPLDVAGGGADRQPRDVPARPRAGRAAVRCPAPGRARPGHPRPASRAARRRLRVESRPVRRAKPTGVRAMIRIAVGGLMHESNTFAASRTDLAAFEAGGLETGPGIAARWGEAHHEVGGFFEAARELGFEAVPDADGLGDPGRAADRRGVRRAGRPPDRVAEGRRPRRRRPARAARGDGRRGPGRRRRRDPVEGPRPDRPGPPARRLARLSRQRLAPDGRRVRRPGRLPHLSARRPEGPGAEGGRDRLERGGGPGPPDPGLEQAAAPDPPAGAGDRARPAPRADGRPRRARPGARVPRRQHPGGLPVCRRRRRRAPRAWS